MDTIASLFSFITTPVSWIIVQFHSCTARSSATTRVGLGPFHRVPGGPDPDLPDPAFREADQGDPGHAGAPAEDEGDPGALQERQAASVRRDDEAVQGDGYQPALLVPSHPGAVPVLLRALHVLAAIANGQDDRRHRPAAAGRVPGRPTSSVLRWPRSSRTAPRRPPRWAPRSPMSGSSPRS